MTNPNTPDVELATEDSQLGDTPFARRSVRGKVTPKSLYTKTIAGQVLELIRVGHALQEIPELLAVPGVDVKVLMIWLYHDLDDFYQRYLEARRFRADYWSEEIILIADESRNDYVDRQTRNGPVRVFDSEHVTRSKMRIDTRLKMMASDNPRRFSDRQTNQVAGPDGNALPTPIIHLVPVRAARPPDDAPTPELVDTRSKKP